MKTTEQLNAEQFDLGKLIQDLNDTSNKMMQHGMEIERERFLPLLAAIFKAYERALGDPKVVIPSSLMAAIAVAQREVGKIRVVGRRAEIPGRPDHDQDIFGRPLKAGT